MLFFQAIEYKVIIHPYFLYADTKLVVDTLHVRIDCIYEYIRYYIIDKRRIMNEIQSSL